jgi:thiamine biosynthesis lipoprotein
MPENEHTYKFTFDAFGTNLSITILEKIPLLTFEKIKMEVINYTSWFDNTFSRFIPYSFISKLATETGKKQVPTELVSMLKVYKEINKISEGYVNPLVGHTLSDLGYDSDYSLKPNEKVRKTPDFGTAVEIIDERNIFLKDKVLIDVGAIGKGFWVDEIRVILEKNNIKSYIIDGSGDILYRTNTKPSLDTSLKVYLENPYSTGESNKNLGYVRIYNQSICGSGIYKRNWTIDKKNSLHHIVDPFKSLPTEKIVATWAIVSNQKLETTMADALATLLFFVDPGKLLTKYNFEYCILYENKKILVSKNFLLEQEKN